MFPIMSCYKEGRFLLIYANNHIAMKIRILNKTFQILEGIR